MKKSVLKLWSLVLVLCMILVGATGCDDYEDYDDYSDEDYYEDDYQDEYQDDYANEGYEEEDDNQSAADSKENENSSNKGGQNLGSAGELEGTTLIVSIFADDKKSAWNFNKSKDEELYQIAYKNLQIGTDWIAKTGKDFGKTNEFIYDWDANTDLYYETKLDLSDITKQVDSDSDKVDEVCWKYIDKNIDVDSLKSKYNADNVVFVFCFNTDNSNDITSCTRDWYEGMAYPYEMCYMFMRCDGEVEGPGAFAHEILHTFGARDLYTADSETGITKEYVKYAEREGTNDIMRVNYDLESDEILYDRVTNEVTDITAYYVGWTNSSKTVKEWKLGKSQH